MKLMAVYGSMREDSNTNKLVKRGAKASGCEYEILELGKLEIKRCTGCGHCSRRSWQAIRGGGNG